MVIVLQTLQVDAEWSQSYCATSWHMTISFFCTSLTCIYGMAGVEAVESRHCQVGGACVWKRGVDWGACACVWACGVRVHGSAHLERELVTYPLSCCPTRDKGKGS